MSNFKSCRPKPGCFRPDGHSFYLWFRFNTSDLDTHPLKWLDDTSVQVECSDMWSSWWQSSRKKKIRDEQSKNDLQSEFNHDFTNHRLTECSGRVIVNKAQQAGGIDCDQRQVCRPPRLEAAPPHGMSDGNKTRQNWTQAWFYFINGSNEPPFSQKVKCYWSQRTKPEISAPRLKWWTHECINIYINVNYSDTYSSA